MNYTTNMASGNTDKLNAEAIRCSIETVVLRAIPDKCCVQKVASGPLTVQTPSMLLKSRAKSCPNPTPAQLALYPRVAVPSSVKTQTLISSYENYAASGAASSAQRFAKYNRWQPPTPCQPLPQAANTAGISKPSTRPCNL